MRILLKYFPSFTFVKIVLRHTDREEGRRYTHTHMVAASSIGILLSLSEIYKIRWKNTVSSIHAFQFN